jgi:dolichol-phosphate mannosyltransferase
MTRLVRLPRPGIVTAVRLAAAAMALLRLARAASAVPPVTAVDTPLDTAFDTPLDTALDTLLDSAIGTRARTPAIDVVIPARDEAHRIAPLLEAVVGAPSVREVIVVDDESSDATAAVAARAGARVVVGAPLRTGWVGKAWALQQGIDASTAEWVVTLDADTRPDPRLPTALVARAIADGADLLTVAGRFDCPTAALRWLHPAMLTTLVYRFGPPGSDHRRRSARVLANGQCMTVHRASFVARGGMEPVAHALVEDVALARHVASAGGRVLFLDASSLLSVRMYESVGDAWRGWGRSLALPGVEPPHRQLRDITILAIAQVLPLARLAVRRADALDAVLLVARAGTLIGTARAYERADAAYWCSPFADAVALAALVRGAVTRRPTWRGRAYDVRRATPARSAHR